MHEQTVTATTNAGAVDDMLSQFANYSGGIDAQSFVSWLNGGVDEFLRQTVSERPFAFANTADFFKAPPHSWPFAAAADLSLFAPGRKKSGASSLFLGLKDLPPLGLGREWETAWRELYAAHEEQQEAAQVISRQVAAIFQTATKRFINAVNTDDGSENEITSLRELYGFWVSIAEEAYAETVMIVQYSQAFGRFINAIAGFRQSLQKITDDLATALNLLNRTDVDAIIHRQHTLEAQVRALETAVQNRPDSDSKELKDRVDALSERIEQLVSAAAKEPAAVRPADRKTTMAVKVTTDSGPKGNKATKRRPRKTGSKPAHQFDIGDFSHSSK